MLPSVAIRLGICPQQSARLRAGVGCPSIPIHAAACQHACDTAPPKTRSWFMPSLEWSESLGRKIRQDEPETLGVSTWQQVRDAIHDRRLDDALELLEYGCEIDK